MHGQLLYDMFSYIIFAGRVRYKFASFWNRNHTFRALQRAVKNFHTMIEDEKQVLNLYIGVIRLDLFFYIIL